MDFIVAYPTTTIAGLFALLICFHFLSSKLRTPKNKPSPPEASGAWPVIGHLHLLGGPQLPHITLGNMADKFGPIFTIRLGTSQALVASSWEIAKELFTTFDIAVSSRPKFIAATHLGYNYAMFGFSPYGPYWRELRKITSIELLSTRRLELLKHVRVSETQTSIKEIYKVWKENNKGGGVVVEMKQWFGDLSLNVILRMIAGKRYFGSGGDSAGEEIEARRCQKLMRDFFYYTGLFLVSDSLPFLRFLDLGGHEKAMKECGKEMDQMIGRWVDEHQRNKDLGVVVGEKDFIDVMLSVVGRKDFGCFDGVTVTKATCMNLLSGGGDTSMVMLTWTLSILLNNPHALRKAQEELDHHIGKERTVNESDLNNLVYLEAIIKETLRLYPAGALGGFREFTEDCTVGGYHVPKGTRLIMNMWKLQRDPRVWPNPLEFKPERFLTTHKNVDVTGQHFELIPFGAGRRLCPGTTFGLQLLRLVLATLLHGFDICTPNDTPIDMTESAGLTNIKATPLEVLLSPRLSPHLY